MARLVDLSHALVAGDETYSWLPAPRVAEFLSRADSRQRYAAGTEFVIHRIDLIGNSGTYLDAPLHRFADGLDLADLTLERVANLPAVVIDITGQSLRPIEAESIASIGTDLQGTAVLFRTNWDRYWQTLEYSAGSPYLTAAAARLLVDEGVSLIGIDALNIDDTDDPVRPAHTALLGAGIPIVENLCRLDHLPKAGFRFSAVPVRIRDCGAFPVRAFAIV